MPISEEIILQLAESKGLVDHFRVQSLRQQFASDIPPGTVNAGAWRIIPLLVENGELTWPDVDDLIDEASRTCPEQMETSSSAAYNENRGDETASQSQARFRLEQFLGSGGMGEVYRAYDTQLRRSVALKRLNLDSPRLRARLMREAQAQARVEHENICKIYDTGEQDGYFFITMQYISGQPLDQAARGLNLEEKVRLVHEVAQGLHAAHIQGLIHRDVKPGNIMVETCPDGRRKPYILDFGLARDMEGQVLTVSADLIGSPLYMSPEQAGGSGADLDRRSDIFSLGVTLYEILAGEPPFSGTTYAQVAFQIIHKEAKPLRQRNPGIPVDLETIVMKCLEKDPCRRYASAREFAEDLGRFLKGEPVLARSIGRFEKLKRKILRHRAAAFMLGGAAFLILALAGLWLHTRWQARRQSEIANQFGRDVEEIESVMRYAFLVKPHDIRPDREAVQKKMADIRKRMDLLGRSGQGAGYYALGQGYLVLRDFSQARVCLDKAWNTGFQPPEAAYALGIALGELFHAETAKADRITDPQMQERVKKNLEKNYLEPALRMLILSRSSRRVPVEYAEALIAFYSKKYDEAQKKITLQEKPGDRFYERKILAGDIFQAVADEKWRQGDYTATMEQYGQAARAFADAKDTGRSDPYAYLRSARLYEKMASLQIETRGENMQTLLDKALLYCDQALQIDPEIAEIHATRAVVLIDLARVLNMKGQDPSMVYDQALSVINRALVIWPNDYYFQYIAGQAWRRKGDYMIRHGTDPIPSMQLAISFFTQALKSNANDLPTHRDMALTLMNMAYHQMLHGQSAEENIRRSIEVSRELAKLYPYLAEAHFILASAYHYQGVMEFLRGGDTSGSLNMAVRESKQAIALNPNVNYYYSNCGVQLVGRGTDEIDRGRDHRKSFAEAVQVQHQALRINANYANAYHCLGIACCEMGRFDVLCGQDAQKNMDMALHYLKKARSLGSSSAESNRYFIRVQRFRALRASWLNQNMERSIASARQRFAEGLQINDSYFFLFDEFAALLCIRAEYQFRNRMPPLSTIREARSLVKRSVRIKPDGHESCRLLAELALIELRFRMINGQVKSLDFNEPEMWLKKALECNPNSAETYVTYAKLCLQRAESMQVQMQKPDIPALIQRGLVAAERAVAINKSCAEAYVIKGKLHKLQASIRKDKNVRQNDLLLAQESFRSGYFLNALLKFYYK